MMTKVMMWGLSSAILLSYTKQAVLLFIRDPQSGSSVHAIEVEDDAHVSDIKTVISNHTDLLRDFGTNPYSLMFRADILKDAQTLSDTGIGSEAVLDILVHKEDLSGLNQAILLQKTRTTMLGIIDMNRRKNINNIIKYRRAKDATFFVICRVDGGIMRIMGTCSLKDRGVHIRLDGTKMMWSP